MPSSLSIAVVVVNWNAGDYLKKCLQSLKSQTLPPTQVLIVDNASTDGSIQRVEEEFREYEIIKLEENTGFAFANNLAVKKAENCEWIAFLNPDAFAAPDWLEKLAEAAEKFPEFTSFGSHMLRYGSDCVDGTGDIYHVCGSAWRRDHGIPSSKIGREMEEIFSPCAAASFIRADVFSDAGGFDENFFAYFEDVDLGFRLQLKGYGCLYVPNAVVEHVGSATTSRFSDFSIYHGQRNLVWSYIRNMPRFWYYLPQHILFNLAAVIWFSLKGKSGPVLKAKWHALKEFPRVWDLRRKTQRERVVETELVLKKMNRGFLVPYSQRKRSL
ncbi:MAG: glycosyltransferase family 2 protein [Nitrospina sp.]|jgi:GT2 family glycosyltransferase|nr:glycosyltransferase family 2 protein [Nitrospina sp.]